MFTTVLIVAMLAALVWVFLESPNNIKDFEVGSDGVPVLNNVYSTASGEIVETEEESSARWYDEDDSDSFFSNDDSSSLFCEMDGFMSSDTGFISDGMGGMSTDF